ncbi:PfkB family carbohydrate kinase [Glutamicibacter halophytocola]|uniref:PfkB family carbohydrate kinase n=1 Tax=Glutamicibacter halophytocola TaxID=1933880 RepID=UPI0032194023
MPPATRGSCWQVACAVAPAWLFARWGERGAVALDLQGRRWEVAAPKVEVVDTNGAGDAFMAGFLGRPPARRAGAGVDGGGCQQCGGSAIEQASASEARTLTGLVPGCSRCVQWRERRNTRIYLKHQVNRSRVIANRKS